MATKTYKITRPCNNFSLVLQGKSGNKQRFEFVGGSVINNVPARVVLRTEYSQQLLENSKPFKDGDIKLERVDNGKLGSKESQNKIPELTPIDSVNSHESLIEWVAVELGKTYQQPKAALVYAEKSGYTFPNLTMDAD